MLFNSLAFLIFFPVVTFLFFILPHKYRWLLLLVSSCFFYMAFIPVYILVLFATIIVDYWAGIYIEKTTDRKTKKIFLIVSLTVTVLILFVFKYFNFFNDNIARLAELIHWNYGIENLKIILPIGLSFHTFQSMSYVIEVFRGNQRAEKSFGIYALYVMFYPQLVAGPIERPQNLLHQFREKHEFNYVRVTEGLKLMAWGMFKKVVIADRLAVMVNQVYANPQEYSGLPLIGATISFAFQIFCDFSGYSDIARGAAQVMGFNLMLNFDRPYFSKSISEFWRRWHISLSTWFKDYLYIPLGGNRASTLRSVLNLLVTFLVSGLWHGANWTFIIWGALNGFYLVFSMLTKGPRKRVAEWIGIVDHPFIYKIFRVSVTFSLICIGWIFFRANNVNDALYILTHLFAGMDDFTARFISCQPTGFYQCALIHINALHWPVPDRAAFFFVIVMEIAHLIQRRISGRTWISQKPLVFRWAFYYGLAFVVSYFGKFGESEFIYFQF